MTAQISVLRLMRGTGTQFWGPLVGLSLAAQPSVAQEATQRAADQREAKIAEIGEIVVTGSRLLRNDEIAPTPVVTLDVQQIEASGATNLGELVDELPSMGLGLNRTQNFGTGAADSLGATLLNQRGLGVNRTLVLVDGRRQVGAVRGTTAVDVSSIPVALIERIEASTGGASVAYGADAVAGVVHVILKKNFSGIETDVRGGVSGEGDAEDYYASLTGGGNFLEKRGNAVLNVTFNRQHGVDGRDREWITRQPFIVPNPADTGPNDGIPAQIVVENGRLPFLTTNGLLLGAVNGVTLQFNPDGTVRPFDPGQPTGGGISIGGDGFDLTGIQTIAVPVERLLVNGRVNYALMPEVNLFLDTKFYKVESSFIGQGTGDFFTHAEDGDFFFLQPDNPFLRFDDPQLAAHFAANTIPGVGPLVLLSRFHEDLGKRTARVDRDSLSFMAGAEGTVSGTSFSWETFYQYGESQENRTDFNNRHSRRFRLATDVTTDANGNPACRATVEAMGPTFDPDIDDCRPLNIFGFGLFDSAARDYAMVDLLSQSEITQHLAGAVLRGELFDLPAGSIGFAGGAEYRRETSDFRPDPLSEQGAVFDGQTLPVRGDYEVTEIFAEAIVPVLRDLPGAQALSVEGGARFSDYDTIGNTTSWRAGLQWAPIKSLRLRAGLAEAVRAPNIGELFSPVEQGFSGIIDPCASSNVDLGPNPQQRLANCTAELALLGLNPSTFADPLLGRTKSILVGGNPDLLEETADTTTVGLVFTPTFLPTFSATVDYFDIEIDRAIATPEVQQIVNDCYDRFDSIDNEFCGLFIRAPSGGQLGVIEDVRATQLNIAALQVRGYDFTLRYQLDTPWLFGGSLGFAVVGTYLDRANFLPASDAAQVNKAAGEIATPRLRGNFDVVYVTGPVSASWRLRYLGAGVFDVQAPPEQLSPNGVSSHTISDFQFGFNFGGRPSSGSGSRFDAYVGVNNVFDKEPPVLTRAGATVPGTSAAYDPIGRFFYAGLRSRF